MQKPVVTHNGMLDWMFLFNYFFEELPPSLSEYKEALHTLFPHIYDTKHLINTRMQFKPFLTKVHTLG